MLAEVAVGVFCLKAVRYCMYMWLPMYLLNQLQYSKGQAGMFSTMFEVGGVLGSAVIGIVLDRYVFGCLIDFSYIHLGFNPRLCMYEMVASLD